MARTVNAVERTARRDAILDAAQTLILSKGCETLTVQDLLDELQISKGAFYHYFASKPAVIESLTERLVLESERGLRRITSDPQLDALGKLQCFFGEIVRWKTARRDVLVAMLPLWHAPGNTSFRLQVDRAAAIQLAPLLTEIIRQGISEKRFALTHPEQAGAVIVALVQALQDAMAQGLLHAAEHIGDTDPAAELAAIHGAHLEAIERCLGIPDSALGRTSPDTVRGWIDAVQQATR